MDKPTIVTKILLTIITVLISLSSHAYQSNILPISETIKTEMLAKKTYQTGCPVSPERLVIVNFSYYDFVGNQHSDGELVVMDAVAKNVEEIFTELFELKFPIQQSRRIEFYDGNDELSLAANNTAAFNCRLITGGSRPSIHSYGLAIDINPIQNPYINNDKTLPNKATVLPDEGVNYLNRINYRPGMTETIVDIFNQHGFTVWGGRWNTPVDWQHFQTPRIIAELLAAMTPLDAEIFFDWYVNNSEKFVTLEKDDQKDLLLLYQKSPEEFKAVLNI